MPLQIKKRYNRGRAGEDVPARIFQRSDVHERKGAARIVLPVGTCAYGFSLFSAIPAAAVEPAAIASESRSGAVQVQQPANAQLIAATSYQLVPGVTETQVILNQKEKEAQVAGFLATHFAPGTRMWHSAHPHAGYYDGGQHGCQPQRGCKGSGSGICRRLRSRPPPMRPRPGKMSFSRQTAITTTCRLRSLSATSLWRAM